MKARNISLESGLDMSISDVELQGDGKKITLFYTAGKSVHFQELINRYRSSFQVKVEMKKNKAPATD